MNITKLFNWNYLIERYPQSGFSWPLRIVLLVIFLGAIVTALYSLWQLRRKTQPKNLWLQLQTWGWSVGLIGLLLIVFRETRAIYLSSRLWLLLWLVASGLWLTYIIYYAKVKLPKIKKPLVTDEEFTKYLPHKKTH